MNTSAVDLSLLVLRVGLGGMLAAHGANKVFGPGGIAGTTRWFETLGFRPAWLHARFAAMTELGSAALMIVGLLTPLACTGFVGLMVVAALTDHRSKGFFVFKGGWEYVGLVGLVALCMAALGPGKWSIDAAAHWHLFGFAWAGFALVIGVLSAVALLLVGRKRSGDVVDR
jgi:putative oxidoreductase